MAPKIQNLGSIFQNFAVALPPCTRLHFHLPHQKNPDNTHEGSLGLRNYLYGGLKTFNEINTRGYGCQR